MDKIHIGWTIEIFGSSVEAGNIIYGTPLLYDTLQI